MAASNTRRARAKPKAKKASTVKPVPAGYPSVTPYLMVDGAAKAVEFYKAVFGARVRMSMPGPNGTLGHAELEVGDSLVMLSDEAPELGYYGPRRTGGTPVGVHLYIPEVDAVIARAVKRGAKVTRPAEDKFYGDRSGTIEDPWGHRWHISTHTEDVPPGEMARRAARAPQG